MVGTLLVGNRQGALTFGPDDVRILETFASHVSASIENERLISTLRQRAEESRHQALHDSLTGLPNRVSFREEVDDGSRPRDTRASPWP